MCGVELAACGPSFQVVYEGDARFEHCYALDEVPTVAMQEKTDCWNQWMRSYTYGQTRNRIDYAASRAKALRDVPVMPTDEAVMGAAPGEGTGRVGKDEPLTTNAFAPPPKTQNDGDAGPASAAPENTAVVTTHPGVPLGVVLPSTTPHEPCTDRCRSEWEVCRGACKGKCAACDHSYGGCMKRCF